MFFSRNKIVRKFTKKKEKKVEKEAKEEKKDNDKGRGREEARVGGRRSYPPGEFYLPHAHRSQGLLFLHPPPVPWSSLYMND